MTDERDLPTSVFGETIDPKDKVSDVYLVPADQRKDTDDDWDADALTEDERDRRVDETDEDEAGGPK